MLEAVAMPGDWTETRRGNAPSDWNHKVVDDGLPPGVETRVWSVEMPFGNSVASVSLKVFSGFELR
jgi:hypothetical protein